MARHRLDRSTGDSDVTEVELNCPPVPETKRLQRRASRQRIAHMAVTITAIGPLVLACASGGSTHQIHSPAAVLYNSPTAANPVDAELTPSMSGPTVVAITPTPTVLRTERSSTTAPPAAVTVSSPGILGIPANVLNAYRHAEQTMSNSEPHCGISWNLLAGIGRIESGHANGGATDSHGTAIRPIYGPALDGTLPGNEIVVEHKGNGTASYARAMGPMQFLPGTWAHYASDGDGDGAADPQNLYDSTLAAARYLCSAGLDMRNPSSAMAAILRYNNSYAYARNVLGWADAYATGVLPADLPPVIGPAPPLADKHLDNPEGLGPGLPFHVHDLPATAPLAQQPLIVIEQPPTSQRPVPWLQQAPTTATPNCTVICIGD